MPAYEFAVIYKILSKSELIQTAKRSAEILYNHSGVITKIEYWGTKELPYRIVKYEMPYTKGSYFCFYCYLPANKIKSLYTEFKLHEDIVRFSFHNQMVESTPSCTLSEELLPPPYRADVQEMIEIAKENKPTPKFHPNTGMTYYPLGR